MVEVEGGGNGNTTDFLLTDVTELATAVDNPYTQAADAISRQLASAAVTIHKVSKDFKLASVSRHVDHRSAGPGTWACGRWPVAGQVSRHGKLDVTAGRMTCEASQHELIAFFVGPQRDKQD